RGTPRHLGRKTPWRRSAWPSLPPRVGAKGGRSKSQRSPHEAHVLTNPFRVKIFTNLSKSNLMRRAGANKTMIKHAPLRLLTGMLILCSLFVGAAFAQGDHYRFVMVSHIGSNDPNMNWLTTSMKTFDEKYPGVKTEYLSTNEYSLQNFIAILNQAIATHPDGIAVPILNNQALQPILDKAISSGIPVVAFNISDPRPVGQRI